MGQESLKSKGLRLVDSVLFCLLQLNVHTSLGNITSTMPILGYQTIFNQASLKCSLGDSSVGVFESLGTSAASSGNVPAILLDKKRICHVTLFVSVQFKIVVPRDSKRPTQPITGNEPRSVRYYITTSLLVFYLCNYIICIYIYIIYLISHI